jgi:RNA polymerase sigma factor (sigma-70 family)
MAALLYELIKDSDKGDQKATMEIIDKFTPVLRKYSKKLNYDGSDTDLIIALIETIAHLSRVNNNEIIDNEGCIVGYIIKSIKSNYIKLSKSWYDVCRHELELDIAIEIPDKDTFCEKEDYIFFNEMLDKLPLLQRTVIEERFLKEKSCNMIAMEMGITRQAVNSLKNRALKNLRECIEPEAINIQGKRGH